MKISLAQLQNKVNKNSVFVKLATCNSLPLENYKQTISAKASLENLVKV